MEPLIFKIIKPKGIDCPDFVPWDFIKNHGKQALRNHMQSLETLNKRGGLTPKELFAVKHNMGWKDLSMRVTEEFATNWLIKELKKVNPHHGAGE